MNNCSTVAVEPSRTPMWIGHTPCVSPWFTMKRFDIPCRNLLWKNLSFCNVVFYVFYLNVILFLKSLILTFLEVIRSNVSHSLSHSLERVAASIDNAMPPPLILCSGMQSHARHLLTWPLHSGPCLGLWNIQKKRFWSYMKIYLLFCVCFCFNLS